MSSRMSHRRSLLAVAFGFAIAATAAARQQQDPALDDVGEVELSSAGSVGRARVKLERKYPSPTSRPFAPERPMQIQLTAGPPSPITQPPTFRSQKPLYGMIRLGRGGRQMVIFDQSAPATAIYDLLWIDRNRDLAFAGEQEVEPIQGVVVTDPEFGVEYVEFTAVRIDVYYGVRIDEAGVEFPDVESLAFTFYGRHPHAGALSSISMIAASWMEGNVEIDGLLGRVVVFDEMARGIHAVGESRWTLLELAADAPLPDGVTLTSSKIPLRLGRKPYRLTALDPEGRLAEVGEETEAGALQALLDNDPLQSEPPRPFASEPVEWLADFDAAEAKAKSLGKPLCVLYTADWSQHARLLAERSLVDEEVARLLREKFVCVKLNPALARSTAVRHGAMLVPTMVFIDRDGNVLDRAIGYRQPRLLADDLRRWRN
jgi:Thioredoxin-like